mmetsp:Transcript_11778/g.23476  ORF Transcript_11778/g.23476 Transcript_11778/m.23476 type:complete len:240 (+) Transcript_11778:145-864(+)
MVFQHRQRPLERQHLKGSNGVAHHHGRHHHAEYAVHHGVPEVWRNLLASDPFARRDERHREEEHVVPRIEAVPERGESVGRHEAAAGAGVDVPSEPVGGLLVPGPRQFLEIGRRLEFEDVDVGGDVPALGVPLVVESLEAGVPQVVGSLGVLPGEVVLLAGEEQPQPAVAVAHDPGLRQDLLGQKGGNVALRVVRIEDGKLAAHDDENTEVQDRLEERRHRRPHVRRDLSLRLARLVVQ